jgi:Flp pilus assembly protein TadG
MDRLARDTSGNTMMIVAAASLPMLALVGGGVDMGRSYLSESRLQQACDAGVLAARKKLAGSTVVDASVANAGNKFFNINFRAGTYGTANRNFTMTLQPDYSISGAATVDVPTTIMKLFGYSEVSLSVKCEASLNFTNTDIMMVLDTTQSMDGKADPGDTLSKLTTMKNVVRSFHQQLEATKGQGVRVRYGFVPYSTNVNVGGLLANNWVVNDWHYQTRELHHEVPTGPVTTTSYGENFLAPTGSSMSEVSSTYPADFVAAGNESQVGSSSCNGPPLPADTYTEVATPIGAPVTVPFVGPPAGTKTTQRFRRVRNGVRWWTSRAGANCNVMKETFTNYIDEYDYVTEPYQPKIQFFNYDKLPRNVANWRSETWNCMEERETYEIDDYTNVDFTRALDLDIRLTPNGDDRTKWRPHYPTITYIRNMAPDGTGPFSINPVITSSGMYQPGAISNMITCPTPTRKLEELPITAGTNATLDAYLNSIVAAGTTYHDIGMIWGGRLLTPFGLFAAENADVAASRPSSRHLIFLTDGQTEAYDIAYGAYGVEPLDRRRWNRETPVGGLTLSDVVEKRFGVACDQVKADNITVWVVGFDTAVTQFMKDCAGPGRWFQANNATDLTTAFTRIAQSIGDLRISK